MSRSFQRPENALKRANEFIDVAKPNRALEVLYEVIKRGKMRNNYSEKLLEPIMFKYVELCVDLKKSHLAKEGLYQYRNIFQSVNVSSLETVVRHYLQLAEDRTEAARKESHQAVVDVDDLDNLATPEEILLSAVSGEDAQDRSDRTILTPWVKFLWESYRQCLELLRTNSRVESLYHDIGKQAFKFCEKYSRKTEFRKLCDILRMHLAHIQKQVKQPGSTTVVNLNNPETQQMNLETRLEQLNYAIKMELWQEAYKAIEDISDLMNKSKKTTKPHVMASYYQKLALVFWKAGNMLFHAAALFKLFQLLRDQKKNITLEEVGKRASIVMIATLAIPLPSAHPEFDRFIETEKSSLEKIEKLANLLSLPKSPTRASLIRDLVRLNVVPAVPTELQNLYYLMEQEFDPLHLCFRMQEHLTWIQEHCDSALKQYIPALQEMTITRLVKQVAQLYQTITFKRLLSLSVFVTPFHLERILVDLVRHNDLQIRIDHKSECIHFGTDLSESQREDLPEGPTLQSLPSETIRCQLVQMGAALQQCLLLIRADSKKKEMEPVRAQAIQLYQQTRQREHIRILQRQHIIEERKEMLENQNLEREESLRRAQEETLKRQKEEEQERLRREASLREKQRQEEQLKEIQKKNFRDKLMQISQTSYGQKIIQNFEDEELLNFDMEDILQRQVEELEKERKELQHRLKAQEKKMDHFERAKRLVEIPLLKKKFDTQREQDREFWKTQEEERIQKLVEDHRVSLENSKRLTRMLTDKEEFLEKLKTDRHCENEKKLNDFNARLEVERKVRLAKRKEQRRQERREKYLQQKAEEEQQRRDEELKKQREEEARLEAEKRQKEEEEYERKLRAEHERQAELIRERERLRERDQDNIIDRSSEDSSWRRGPSKVEGNQNQEDEKENIEDDEGKSKPWRPGGGAWRNKQNEKLNAWRRKNDEPDQRDEANSRDIKKDDRDLRKIDRGDRDIKKLEDGDFRRGDDRDFRRSDDRDFRRGDDRDFRRGDDRDFRRGDDRDFRRGDDRDFRRGDERDFRRGDDRDFRRDGRDYRRRDDRDFRRDDRDFRRDDRDFRRGDDRDFRRSDERDLRRGDDRDFHRSDDRDSWRGVDRDFKRGDDRKDDRDDRDFRRMDEGREFRRDDREFRRGDRDDRDHDFRRGDKDDRDGRKDDDDTRGPPRGWGDRGDRDFGRRNFDRDRRVFSRADEGGSWRSSGPVQRPRRDERHDRRDEKDDHGNEDDGRGWRGHRDEDRKDEKRDDHRSERDDGDRRPWRPRRDDIRKDDLVKGEPQPSRNKPTREEPDEEGWTTVRH